MGWQGAVALVALLAVGTGAGYGASRALGPEPSGSGAAEPVVARRPSIPVDPTVEPAPDPADPPLLPGIPLTTATMGTGKLAITYPAPAGWRRNATAVNEAKWKKPGTSNNTYVLRVELIRSRELTVEAAIEDRLALLDANQDEVRVVDRGADSLAYTYRSDEGNARHTFMRWTDVDGDGRAELEVVVHGRERDAAGTSDLAARVAAGVRVG
jgi:hypothetical protein